MQTSSPFSFFNQDPTCRISIQYRSINTERRKAIFRISHLVSYSLNPTFLLNLDIQNREKGTLGPPLTTPEWESDYNNKSDPSHVGSTLSTL